MKTTHLIIALFLTFLASHAQKKKVVYLDTLGNVTNIMEHISILNTAWYTWDLDESDPKTRYVGFKKLSKKEHDSVASVTYQKKPHSE